MRIRAALFAAILFTSVICEASANTDLKTYSDISYTVKTDQDDLRKLNLVIPDAKDPTPLLVWIGGGAWSYVDHNKEMDLAEKIAKMGIAVAPIGHRLSAATWQNPERIKGVQHPSHIEDVAAAVYWLTQHGKDYNIDLGKIYVGGFSSGAHLAALLASDPKYLEQYQLSTDTVKGVISIGGSYDILDYHRAFAEGSRPELAIKHVEAVFGNKKRDMASASPINYVEDLTTPLLLISDRNTYNYTRLYEDALVEAQVQNLTVLHIRNLGHGPLWQHLSHAPKSPYRDMILSFIRNNIPKN